jgi:hypothetical protein
MRSFSHLLRRLLRHTEIRDPGLVGLNHRELALQEIGKQDGGLADRPAPYSITMERAQVVLAHQARHAMLAAGFAWLTKI